MVPMRQPRITGYGGRCACCVITRARRSTPKAVGRVSFGAHHAREILKGQPSGGHAEQASNTARGTPEKRRTCGATGDQPVARAERPNRPARDRAASVSRDAEARGSIVTPAFRAPSLFSGATELDFGLRANPAPAKQYGRRSYGEMQVVNRGYECRCRGLQPSPRLKCVHARRRRDLAVGRVDRRSVAQAGGVGGLRILAIPPTPARSPRSRRRPSPPLRGEGKRSKRHAPGFLCTRGRAGARR